MKHVKIFTSKELYIDSKDSLINPSISGIRNYTMPNGTVVPVKIMWPEYELDSNEDNQEEPEDNQEELNREMVTKYEFNETIYDSPEEAEQAVIDYYKVVKYHYDDNHFDSTSDVEDYIKEHASESDYIPSVDYTEEYYYPNEDYYAGDSTEIVYTKSDEEIAQDLWDSYKYVSYFRESGCGVYAVTDDEFIEYCKNWKMNQCTLYDYNSTIYSLESEFIDAYKNDLSYEEYYYYPNKNYYTSDSNEILYTKTDEEIAQEIWDSSSEYKYFISAGCGYHEVSTLETGYYVDDHIVSESEFIDYIKSISTTAQEMSDEDILSGWGSYYYKEPYEKKIYTTNSGDICYSEEDVLNYLNEDIKSGYIDTYREDVILIDGNYYHGTFDSYVSENSSSWVSDYSEDGYYYNGDYFLYDDSNLDSYILSTFGPGNTKEIYTTSNGDVCLSASDIVYYLTDNDKSYYIDTNYITVYYIDGKYYNNVSDYTDENKESWLNDYASSIVSSSSVYTCECVFNSNNELVWHEGSQESGYNDFMNNEISEIEVKA